MNFSASCVEREASGRPLRVGLIGAGKFGSMYLAQVPRTPGIHLVGIADLSPANARANLAARGLAEGALLGILARRRGEDGHDACRRRLAGAGGASGNRDHHRMHRKSASRRSSTALAAFRHGKHVINVTVEADAFCGPLLAHKARPGRRDLQPGLWRPAGARLRTGRLGADRRLPGRRCRPRP